MVSTRYRFRILSPFWFVKVLSSRYHSVMDTLAVTALLERLCTLLRNDARLRGLPHGLQPVQVEALLYLSRCNRYSDTPQAVSDFLASTKGTVSQTLKVLERHGLLVKRQDSHDRRVVRLRLTPVGTQLARKLAVPAVLAQALLADPSRGERLATELGGLLVAMQQIAGHRAFGTCHTCRFFRREDNGFRCGLTTEPLTPADSKLICREHETKVDDLP